MPRPGQSFTARGDNGGALTRFADGTTPCATRLKLSPSSQARPTAYQNPKHVQNLLPLSHADKARGAASQSHTHRVRCRRRSMKPWPLPTLAPSSKLFATSPSIPPARAVSYYHAPEKARHRGKISCLSSALLRCRLFCRASHDRRRPSRYLTSFRVFFSGLLLAWWSRTCMAARSTRNMGLS
jgi:hypothetical protein